MPSLKAPKLKHHVIISSYTLILCVSHLQVTHHSPSLLEDVNPWLTVSIPNTTALKILNDFNIHVDNPFKTLASQFFHLSYNLVFSLT